MWLGMNPLLMNHTTAHMAPQSMDYVAICLTETMFVSCENKDQQPNPPGAPAIILMQMVCPDRSLS